MSRPSAATCTADCNVGLGTAVFEQLDRSVIFRRLRRLLACEGENGQKTGGVTPNEYAEPRRRRRLLYISLSLFLSLRRTSSTGWMLTNVVTRQHPVCLRLPAGTSAAVARSRIRARASDVVVCFYIRRSFYWPNSAFSVTSVPITLCEQRAASRFVLLYSHFLLFDC